MALTNAEKVRAHRERKKAQRNAFLGEAEAPDLIDLIKQPFSEWFERYGNSTDFAIALDQGGLIPPDFSDDHLPKSATGEIELLYDREPNESPYARGGGSLAQAEIMVGCLISATALLARAVNEFKQTEIRARIAEIEQSDLSDPETKRKALADIPRLQKMLDQLSKQVRWTFPQWKVTGD